MNGAGADGQDGTLADDHTDFNEDQVVPYLLFSQHVSLTVNFLEKTIMGESTLSLIMHSNDWDEVEIDARQCEIDISNITIGGEKAKATYIDPNTALEVAPAWNFSVEQHHIQQERMDLMRQHYDRDAPVSRPIPFGCQPIFKSVKIQIPGSDKRRRKGDARRLEQERKNNNNQGAQLVDDDDRNKVLVTIVVPFKITDPKDGYHFVGLEALDERYPHLYTRHSIDPGTACSVFPTIDDTCSNASWKISVTVPKTLGAALGQPPSASSNANHEHVDEQGDDVDGNGSKKHSRKLTEAEKILEMTVVCAGMLTDESSTDTTKTMAFDINLDHSVPARYVGFAVGPFEHVDLWSGFRTEEDEEKIAGQGLKIHGYCLPGRAHEVENICGALVTCADHLMLAIGKYSHWDYSFKLCFVDDMVEDAIPLVSFALCSSSLLFDDTIIDRDMPVLRELTYCLAWQYSGICLVPDSLRDRWVIYGIAGFLTELALTNMFGDNHHRFYTKTLCDQLIDSDVDMPSLETLGNVLHIGPELVNFMKLKSCLVMSILDRRLAKKKASKGLVRVMARMFMKVKSAGNGLMDAIAARCVTSSFFRERCEKFADLSLESFWSQWVESSSCAKFELIQKFNKKRLCVELLVRQVHDPVVERKLPQPPEKSRAIERRQFWPRLQALQHGLAPNKAPTMFTGPLTIKIHEADGTPYEHTVEIREDPHKISKFEIPYNTKYKRIKRNRRQRERLANANQPGNFEGGAENQDEQVIYMLGDVLQSRQDMEAWDLRDWDEGQEKAMDGESYEWIRFDADTEWICHTRSNMPSYMQISQLQQDRDVAAQQQSLLYLKDEKPHPLAATFLVRTVMDKRYYWGIRTMAASLLTRQNGPGMDLLGAKHLMRAFQELFCFPDTQTVRPNDFQDKRDYFVQCEIPRALSRVRDEQGNCPQVIGEFLLNQLRFNDNKQNYFSDAHYVATLIRALATSLVPGDPDRPIQKQKKLSLQASSRLSMEQHNKRAQEQEHIRKCMEEIERYRRMDEWNPSYRNLWTIAALDSTQWLMKAGVVDPHPVSFLVYLSDQFEDDVRAKALGCLAELGFIFHSAILPVFTAMFTTVRSPYMRDQLFQILCVGLAGVATGSDKLERSPRANATERAREDVEMPDAPSRINGDVDSDAEADEEPALVVVRSEEATRQNQIDRARLETIEGALSALKAEVTNHTAIRKAIWKIITSFVLGWTERKRLLDLCQHIFPVDFSLVTTVQYPLRWKYVGKDTVIPNAKNPRTKSLIVKFKSYYKTKASSMHVGPDLVQSPPKPALVRTISLLVKQPAKSPVAKQPAQTPKPTAKKITTKVTISKDGPEEGRTVVHSQPHSQLPDAFSLRPNNPKPHETASPAAPVPAPAPAALNLDPVTSSRPFATAKSISAAKSPVVAKPTSTKPLATTKPASAKSPAISKPRQPNHAVNGEKPIVGSGKKSRKRERERELVDLPRKRKLVSLPFTKFDKIKGFSVNAQPTKGTPSNPPISRTPLPATPVLGQNKMANNSTPSSKPGGSKPRRPLPSRAQGQQSLVPAAVAASRSLQSSQEPRSATPPTKATAAGPSKIIRLKLKSSVAGAGAGSPTTPKVGTPKVGTPKVGMPKVGTPKVGTPKPTTTTTTTPGPKPKAK